MPTEAELEQENALLKARVGDLELRVRTLQNGSKHKADPFASPKGIFNAAVLLAAIIILAHVISVYVGLPGLPTGSVAKMFVIFLLIFLISFPLFSALFFGIRIDMKAKLSHFFTPAAEVSTADVSEARTSSKGL